MTLFVTLTYSEQILLDTPYLSFIRNNRSCSHYIFKHRSISSNEHQEEVFEPPARKQAQRHIRTNRDTILNDSSEIKLSMTNVVSQALIYCTACGLWRPFSRRMCINSLLHSIRFIVCRMVTCHPADLKMCDPGLQFSKQNTSRILFRELKLCMRAL